MQNQRPRTEKVQGRFLIFIYNFVDIFPFSPAAQEQIIRFFRQKGKIKKFYGFVKHFAGNCVYLSRNTFSRGKEALHDGRRADHRAVLCALVGCHQRAGQEIRQALPQARGQHPCKRAGCGGVRERCVLKHLERDPAAASGIASGVCRHARPPLFDHALSCQHGNETKQPLRYVHGGA